MSSATEAEQLQKSRKESEAEVKNKIKQILLSVKAEKQHIENQLARNDKKIK